MRGSENWTRYQFGGSPKMSVKSASLICGLIEGVWASDGGGGAQASNPLLVMPLWQGEWPLWSKTEIRSIFVNNVIMLLVTFAPSINNEPAEVFTLTHEIDLVSPIWGCSDWLQVVFVLFVCLLCLFVCLFVFVCF